MLTKMAKTAALICLFYVVAMVVGSAAWNIILVLPNILVGTIEMIIANKQVHLITLITLVIIYSLYSFIKVKFKSN